MAHHPSESLPPQLTSLLSQISAGPLSAFSSKGIEKAGLIADPSGVDTTSTALSCFILETVSHQLQQYHLSTLGEATTFLNRGQGLDYSIDVTKTDDGTLVVVKHFRKHVETRPWSSIARNPQSAKVWKALQEVRIMTHPPVAECENVLCIMGYGWDFVDGTTTTPCLVVEFANRGNLREHLVSAGETISGAEKLDISLGLARGLTCLHESGITHGDVKLENMLISATAEGRLIPIVSDFGSSIITTSGEPFYRYWGTDIYNAPEVRRQGTGQHGARIVKDEVFYCDIWSFGLLVLEIALNGQCYVDQKVAKILDDGDGASLSAACLRKFDEAMSTATEVDFIFRTIIAQSLCEISIQRPRLDWINTSSAAQSDPMAEMMTVPEPLYPKFDASVSIIDLPHSITLRAILKGRGTSLFTPEKIPWSVQVEICKRYEILAKEEYPEIRGYAHLSWAICHYVGLGVERDLKEMNEHLHASALLGTPEARLSISQISKALGFTVREEELRQVCDPEFDEELMMICSAFDKTPYRTPFSELLELRTSRLSKFRVNVVDLHTAAAVGYCEVVQDLLASGHKDFLNAQGETAILLACMNGHLAVAKLLLEKGSDASIADQNGFTPLHMLIMFPEEHVFEVCSLIIKSSPKVDIEASTSTTTTLPDYFDELVGTPLQWATIACNFASVEALLACGASPNSCKVGYKPIQIASYLFTHEILAILIRACKDNSEQGEQHGLFYLNEAHPFRPLVIHGDKIQDAIARTVRLLSNGQGVDVQTVRGTTPLMKMALTNISWTDVLLVRELLKHCDTSEEVRQFSTIQAGIMGCNGAPSESLAEVTLLLIEAGFSPRSVSTKTGPWPGWNAMHWASAGPHYRVVEALYHKDPELVNIPTDFENKDYPIHIAAQASYGLGMIKLLLKLGADPSSEAGFGQTALANCIGENRLEVDLQKLELLLTLHADNGYIVQSRETTKITVLHFAALRSARLDMEGLPGYELVRWLLQKPEIKELVNNVNGNGITPLHLVCYRPDVSTIRLLVEAGADINLNAPDEMSPLGIALEYARAPQPGWAERDLDHVWYKSAYEAASYLSNRMIGTSQDKRLSRLHIAAYCSYVEEVIRLVERENADLNALSAKGYTPRTMLAGLLHQYLTTRTPIDRRYLVRAQKILIYLNGRMAGQENTAEQEQWNLFPRVTSS